MPLQITKINIDDPVFVLKNNNQCNNITSIIKLKINKMSLTG